MTGFDPSLTKHWTSLKAYRELEAEAERLREERDYWKSIVEHYRRVESDHYLAMFEVAVPLPEESRDR